MALDTGALENGLKRVEQFQTIPKTFERKLKFRNGKRTDIVRDTSGIFRTNISLTNGTDVTLDNKNNLPILETKYSNDNNTHFQTLTFGNDWIFNYPVSITALASVEEDSEVFVQDGNSYNTFTAKTSNLPSGWEVDMDLYIVNALDEYPIGWNDTITITSTSSAYFKMKNTSGSDIVFDMYDSVGKPIILEIKYEMI